MELYLPRLILRDFRPGDFEDLREFESSPETHRYEKPIPGEAEIRTFLNEAVGWTQEYPRMHYRLALTVRPENTVRGRISLMTNNAGIQEWEISWTVHQRYWGKGYASEAARGALAFAFNELQVHRVIAFCHVANTASTRVMEKIGMQREGRLRESRRWDGGWSDEFLYAILRRDWEPGGW